MQFDWRSMSGPALAAATALFAIVVDRYLKGAPYPAPLFICIVALAGSLGGLFSAATSGGICPFNAARSGWKSVPTKNG